MCVCARERDVGTQHVDSMFKIKHTQSVVGTKNVHCMNTNLTTERESARERADGTQHVDSMFEENTHI